MITKFSQDTLNSHPDFMQSDLKLNILNSRENEITVASTYFAIDDTPFDIPSSSALVNSILSYNAIISLSIYSQTNDQSFSIIGGSNTTFIPDLTWSPSGTTMISFNTAAYGSNPLPSFVSVNSSTGAMRVAAPNVTADTTYIFYINAVISGLTNPVKKKRLILQFLSAL